MADASCSSSTPSPCSPATCGQRCALEVIDDLLAHGGSISGEDADLLLDLRWHLRRLEQPEVALRLFCELRLRLEQRNYMAFFRIRRWIENHLVAEVRICPAAEPQTVPVRLNHYCVEAIRRVCLCAGLGAQAVLLAPRLQFLFRPHATLAGALNRQVAAVVS